MPIFLSMTSELSTQERNKTARKAVVIAAFTLIAFAFSGEFLFRFFGISINSLRIVGGVVFFTMGYDMLQARLARIKIDKQEMNEYVNDISVTPLAIPMICGPGAITNAIVLMEDAKDIPSTLVVIAAILAVSTVTLLILFGAGRITKLMGEVGNKVMMRLMGLIVMVIAVEFFFTGIKPFIQQFLVQ